MDTFIQLLLALLAIFLILLVLVQRGRGGGLAGVLGGSGGSSAFGAKAGDVFTRITMVTAALWIILCAAALAIFGRNPDAANLNVKPGEGDAVSAATTDDGSGSAPDAEGASDDAAPPE